MADEKVHVEQKMRDSEAPHPKSIEELSAFIESMVGGQHDYGTCVYAMSLSAVAAFNYVASKLGVTGFQASCADMDILARTRNWKWGQIQNYENLLYPQYCDEEHFPTAATLIEKNKVELAKRARKLIAESSTSHTAVLAHWQYLSSLSPEEPTP
jgi:hypothetical protein